MIRPKKKYKPGFTLIEVMIVLVISGIILLMVPLISNYHLTSYQEKLFFKEFENRFKVAQMSAITTDSLSMITFLGQPINMVQFRITGDESLNTKLKLPESVKMTKNVDMILRQTTGTPNKFQDIVFVKEDQWIIYHFQMGAARYYVERIEK